MLKLVRFDLRNPAEWDEFYNLFSAYLAEVHSAAANGRWCGDQRPPCGLKTAG